MTSRDIVFAVLILVLGLYSAHKYAEDALEQRAETVRENTLLEEPEGETGAQQSRPTRPRLVPYGQVTPEPTKSPASSAGAKPLFTEKIFEAEFQESFPGLLAHSWSTGNESRGGQPVVIDKASYCKLKILYEQNPCYTTGLIHLSSQETFEFSRSFNRMIAEAIERNGKAGPHTFQAGRPIDPKGDRVTEGIPLCEVDIEFQEGKSTTRVTYGSVAAKLRRVLVVPRGDQGKRAIRVEFKSEKWFQGSPSGNWRLKHIECFLPDGDEPQGWINKLAYVHLQAILGFQGSCREGGRYEPRKEATALQTCLSSFSN